DPFQLDRTFKKNNSILVPQCGVAPGLSNICVGDASRKIPSIQSVRIMVGGLPRFPKPPLNYRFVFSPDDVINEYTRSATVISNGHSKTVPPLSGLALMRFPGVGQLEYFVTDGLGTLPKSFPSVAEMAEYTLRYPGHAMLMESLRVLGLLDRTPVKIGMTMLEPRRLVLELMRSLADATRKEDLLAFKVEVRGRKGRKPIKVTYEMLDHYDSRSKASAMARTTAYTCTAVAHLVASGRVEEKGVVTPEQLGRVDSLFSFVRSYLATRRVRLKILSRIQPS
ncbi:MAG TPA: saccharopine dehydrogenase C-terminal domain-containing protein, partial [Candidatus Binatus sp.]|nr:saccharopine dehydrogenase C-terminal domain-containing protein [Candidatus Binatus sp.]